MVHDDDNVVVFQTKMHTSNRVAKSSIVWGRTGSYDRWTFYAKLFRHFAKISFRRGTFITQTSFVVDERFV